MDTFWILVKAFLIVTVAAFWLMLLGYYAMSQWLSNRLSEDDNYVRTGTRSTPRRPEGY